MTEQSKNKLLFVISSVLMTAVAVVLWLYLLKHGGANRTRVIDTAIALSKGGDPDRGAQIINKVGCAGCHEIPGISAAHGKVGPSLSGFKDRAMIGGVLANTPDNLVKWLQDPPKVDSKTAMPDLGLTAEQSRDIAAYLYAPR